MSENSEQIEHSVAAVIKSEDDIYEKVKKITLEALTQRSLDIKHIEEVAAAVGKGISKGVDSQLETSRTVMDQATKALDDALASTAEATKLAVEEAGTKMHDFSEQNLQQTLDELKGLESLLIETMQGMVKESSGAAVEIAEDLLTHAKTRGTAVGEQVKETSETIMNSLLKGESSALSNAKDTASTLASIGSGILAGLSESLGQINKKDESN